MNREASRIQLQELHHLIKEKRYREELGYVVLQGSNMVWEWIQSGHEVIALFKSDKAPSFTSHDYSVEPRLLSQVAGLESTAENYHIAIIKKPEFTKPLFSKDTLILDGVQDPGNIGTLMRSARAFGFNQIVLTQGSCDPYNDKVIRSSQGASVYLDLWKASIEELEALLFEEKITPWIAHAKSEHSMDPESFVKEAKTKPVWLVIGSEGKGPCKQLLEKGQSLHLPMASCVESLNAAVAGSILTSYVYQARLSKEKAL